MWEGGELAIHLLGLFGSLAVGTTQSHSLCLGKNTMGASRENISENSPEEKHHEGLNFTSSSG